MADIEKTLKINTEIGDTQTKLEAIERQLEILIQENEELAAAGKETTRTFENNSKAIKDLTTDIQLKNNKLSELKGKLDSTKTSTDKFTNSTNTSKKAVLENGGAMGLLGAATGGLAMDFKDGIEAVEGMGISLKGLRGAIIATGIGALAVIVLELVTNWEKWSGVIDGTTSALGKINTELERVRDNFDDIKYQGDLSIQIMELEGKSIVEIGNQRRKNFEEQRDNLIQQTELERQALQERIQSYLKWSSLTGGLIQQQDKLKEAVEALAKTEETLKKLNDSFYVDTLKQDKEETSQREAEDAKRKALRDKANAEKKKALEDERKRQFDAWEAGLKAEKDFYDARKKLQDEFNAETEKTEEDRLNAQVEILTRLTQAKDDALLTDDERALKEIENQAYRDQIKLEALGFTQEQIDELLSVYDIKRDELKLEKIERERTEEELLAQEKIDRQKAVLDSLSQFAGQETALGKAILIAKQAIAAKELILSIKSTLMQAKESATKATLKGAEAGADIASGAAKTAAAAPFPANIPLIVGYAATAVGIIGSVIAAVKKVKGARADSSSLGGSAGGGGTPTPQASFNIVGQSSSNQLAQSIGEQQNQPIQAYVVGSDVSSQQSLDRNRIQNSTFL